MHVWFSLTFWNLIPAIAESITCSPMLFMRGHTGNGHICHSLREDLSVVFPSACLWQMTIHMEPYISVLNIPLVAVTQVREWLKSIQGWCNFISFCMGDEKMQKMCTHFLKYMSTQLIPLEVCCCYINMPNVWIMLYVNMTWSLYKMKLYTFCDQEFHCICKNLGALICHQFTSWNGSRHCC